ncbi:tetratricopeptide repeat-containing sensor histidine kinase [Winogradskyella ouciana]|uniref:histidine kinase n=1 Tax=Winogradskyella ouciana TaxID=2608631 RepID=A0A7K1GCI1_9FLAO|nr:histidine kinase dimerization/phosphoacceptor domain -containing protein [Winogradskyella ouciana]MTE26863.1 tetratricopeptide repeat protein [Winogradskyella ouciana]
MKLYLRYLILCVAISHFSYAQDAAPDAYQDSLQTVIKTAKQNADKKEAHFLLGEYLVQRDPDLAERMANTLKNEIIDANDSFEVRRTNYIFAASHRWQGDYKTALEYYDGIYNYSKEQNDSIDIAKSAHFIGTISMFLGNNVESQNKLLEAAKIYDKIGSAKQQARINKSLASFYLNVGQLEKGKEQYLKALTQFEKLNDSTGLASVNANLGMVYTDLGDYEKAEYHLMKQKEYNVVFPTLREMGFHHDFLGLLRQEQGRLDEAYDEHLKALRIRENLSSTYNLCESKIHMGEILIKLNRYNEAISHLEDVFSFEEHESLNQEQRAYDLLAEAYEKKGDYKSALSNFKEYTAMNDSIYTKESIEIIAEKDARYNQQKKDAEIAILNKEKELSETKLSRSRAIVIMSLIGLVLLGIAAIALLKLNKKIKKKNQTITKALEDRELLLHETHHRVKNNLQMISSLLNLQSKYVNDKDVYEVLQKGRNRVQSMALLHKNLYVGEDLTKVDIQEYFEGLVNSILTSYNKSEEDISLNIEAHNLKMDVESVIPIGLIVNELVTNSLKHAFPKDWTSKPSIDVEMEENRTDYTLKIKDNGVGMDDLVEKSGKETSFGQRLVRSLSQKLKATINMTNHNGTEVSIVMPK